MCAVSAERRSPNCSNCVFFQRIDVSDLKRLAESRVTGPELREKPLKRNTALCSQVLPLPGHRLPHADRLGAWRPERHRPTPAARVGNAYVERGVRAQPVARAGRRLGLRVRVSLVLDAQHPKTCASQSKYKILRVQEAHSE